MTSTDVAQYQPAAPPSEREWAHLERTAAVLSKTNLVPEHFRGKADDIMIAGLGLRSLGMQLDINTLCQVYVVKGKPGYMAQLQIGLARRSGIDIKFDQDRCTAESATVEIRDRTGWHAVTFTMADAVRAKLPDQNPTYKSYPDRMLLARAVTKAIGAYASHVKLGIDIDGPPQAWQDGDETGEIPAATQGVEADAGVGPNQGSPDIETPVGPASATTLERLLLRSLIDQLDEPRKVRLRALAKQEIFTGMCRDMESGNFTSDRAHALSVLIARVRAEPSDPAAATPGGAEEAATGPGNGRADPGPQAADDNPERPFE